jgi:hypothetical protein
MRRPRFLIPLGDRRILPDLQSEVALRDFLRVELHTLNRLVSLHVRAEDGIDAGLVSALAAKPAQQVGVKAA